MDKPNIFTEDNDYNICLSWLCDSTDGQTYSISDWFGKKLKRPEGMDEYDWVNAIEGVFNWQVWEDAVGWKHDYRVDDPEAAVAAKKMVEDLNTIIGLLNINPNYMNWGEDFLRKAGVKEIDTEKEIESLVDKAIMDNTPNTMLYTYWKETGRDPVPEDGGHTEEFENWFVNLVRTAYLSHGVRTLGGLKEFLKTIRKYGK